MGSDLQKVGVFHSAVLHELCSFLKISDIVS